LLAGLNQSETRRHSNVEITFFNTFLLNLGYCAEGKQKKANPRPSENGDSAEPSLEKQVFHGKKKVVFLLSWAQRYGMCLAATCAELSLELGMSLK
jgi:hypothetical protein